MIELHGTIEDSEIRLLKGQLVLRKQWLTTTKDGSRIVEILKLERKGKTYSQVKAYWGFAIKMILDAFEERGTDSSELIKTPDNAPTGNPVKEGLLHAYLYQVCPMFDDDNNQITLSNKNADITKVAKFFDDVRNFASSIWGIYIPEPDKNWKNKKNGKKKL